MAKDPEKLNRVIYFGSGLIAFICGTFSLLLSGFHPILSTVILYFSAYCLDSYVMSLRKLEGRK